MKVHGFVQAGGGSTRFGTDKALVQVGGKTMLRRTGELLAGICDDVTIVAPALKYRDAPLPVLADSWPGEGPLGGILTALGSLRGAERTSDWAMILGCDMPFLTREFLGELRARALRSAALVIVPRSASGFEPLCACWSFRALSAVQGAFELGIRRVTEAMKRLPMEVLDESFWKRFDTQNRLFWNMNTPADYEEAQRIWEPPKL